MCDGIHGVDQQLHLIIAGISGCSMIVEAVSYVHIYIISFY